MHNHSSKCDFLSANIFIDGSTEIGTHYVIQDKLVKQANVVGEITVFSSNIRHMVPANPSTNTRITLAMDIHSMIETENAFYDLKRFIIIQ